MENKIKAYLTRLRRSDHGTEGILTIPALGFSCFTLELPWRDNRSNVSCIPPGTYPVSWRVTRRRATYHIKNVPGRTYILIHSGNYAGDVTKGLKSHVEGCIELGTRMGWIGRQRAVLLSRNMMRKFHKLMNGRDAELTIIDPWENKS